VDLYRFPGAGHVLLFATAVALLPVLVLGGATQPASVSTRFAYYGVNLHPLQDRYALYPPAQTLQLAGDIGSSVVRIDIHWEWIEYLRPGTASWYMPQIQQLDAFLAEAARRRIRVLATIQDTPCWASNEMGKLCPPARPHYHGSYPPANAQVYANFLARLVHHVGRRIQYYEIWNEPNLTRFWAHPDPLAYARLLRAAYRAVKSEDPSAQVLAGATSGTDTGFIDRMYEAGARGYFDALSVHPYSANRSPRACSAPTTSFQCGVQQVRRVMLRHGDTRPIWLTEFGESVSAGVTSSTQAGYVTQTLSLIRHWSFVRGAVWYELYDDPTGHDGEHFGLLEGNLCPRLAAFAFRSNVLATKSPATKLRCPPSASTPRQRARHLLIRPYSYPSPSTDPSPCNVRPGFGATSRSDHATGP
jgi:hypothetical protein